MEFGRAVLQTARGISYIGLDELDAAAPDPLAPYEAGMLTHLLDDHADLVTLLLRLVRPMPTAAVARALPVAMDRYGITLRLEEQRGHRDVRLPFPSPSTTSTSPAHRSRRSSARRAGARTATRCRPEGAEGEEEE